MNYLKIYENLCARGKQTRDFKYTESHHVIPKCLGGSNDSSNFTTLSAKEHYLAHKLLTKIHANNPKILHAYAMMSVDSLRTKRKYTSKQYQNMKEARSAAMKLDNPMFKQKNKDAQAIIGGLKWKENNPMLKESNKNAARKRMTENNPNKGGASNHTAKPIEVEYNDGRIERYEYGKKFAETTEISYSTVKTLIRTGKSSPKYDIKEIRQV